MPRAPAGARAAASEQQHLQQGAGMQPVSTTEDDPGASGLTQGVENMDVEDPTRREGDGADNYEQGERRVRRRRQGQESCELLRCAMCHVPKCRCPPGSGQSRIDAAPCAGAHGSGPAARSHLPAPAVGERGLQSVRVDSSAHEPILCALWMCHGHSSSSARRRGARQAARPSSGARLAAAARDNAALCSAASFGSRDWTATAA